MRTVYKIGQFIDYAGRTRSFVMAAVCIELNSVRTSDYKDTNYSNDDNFLPKVISIGVSVCRPNDTFDKALGITIAEGKAKKYRYHALYLTDGGMANDKVINALLDQEMMFFQKDPGYYLAGYDKDAAKYAEQERVKGYEAAIEGDEKTAYNFIKGASPEIIDEMMDMLSCGEKL